MNFTVNIVSRNSLASRYFDLLRAIAAISVVLFHARASFFVQESGIVDPNIAIKIVYFLTGRGQEFVMVFFVLSGFFISGSVLKSVINHKWSWKNYLINRLSRLWIVLIPALILTAIIGYLQVHVNGDPWHISGTLDINSFFGNILFLQWIFVPIYGQNGPLWSLMYEFWYYIAFALIVSFVCAKPKWHKTIYALLLICLVALVRVHMIYFPIWLMGTAIVMLPKVQISQSMYKYVAFPVSMLLFGLSFAYSDRVNDSYLAYIFVGIGTASVMYVLFHMFNEKAIINPGFDICAFLAGFSYTLYLTHFPVLKLVVPWIGLAKQPTFRNLVLISILVLGLIFYAWLVAFFTERKTDTIRSHVYALFALTHRPTIAEQKS